MEKLADPVLRCRYMHKHRSQARALARIDILEPSSFCSHANESR